MGHQDRAGAAGGEVSDSLKLSRASYHAVIQPDRARSRFDIGGRTKLVWRSGMAEGEVLGRVPLFAQLPADALSDLASHLRHRRFPRNGMVFSQGDPGASLCIVHAGRVKLSLTSTGGREMIIDLFGPGEVFGELALLDGEPRSADALAVEPTDLLMLDRTDFVNALMRRPELAIGVLALLGRRLRRDAALLQDAAFLDVPTRLARTLVRLAETPPDGGPPVTPRLSQSDLAGLTGTTRETLNKWLGVFQDEQLISLGKGRITILQPKALRTRTS
jgi:CRP/FNR family cyclic AMP-dependent transcriptional regulator